MEQVRKYRYTLPCRQSWYGVDDGKLAGEVDNRRRQCIRWISDERALAGTGPFRFQPLFACRESCGLTGGRVVSLIYEADPVYVYVYSARVVPRGGERSLQHVTTAVDTAVYFVEHTDS